MTDVSIPAAFGAGIISFVSPCVLPLAAPSRCYLAGTMVEALTDEGEARARRDILVTALLFVAGFSTVLVALGASASATSSLLRHLNEPKPYLFGLGWLSLIAGVGI